MIKFILSFSGQDGHACIVPANKSYFHLESYGYLSNGARLTTENGTTRILSGTFKAHSGFKFKHHWTISAENEELFLERYLNAFKAHSGTKRTSKAVRVKLSALISNMTHSARNNRPVIYSRSTSKRNTVLINLVDFMASKGMIQHVKGKANEYQDNSSWFIATPKFSLEAERERIKIEFSKDSSFLVLRDETKDDIAIKKTRKNRLQLQALSAPIVAYNHTWLSHSATLDGKELIPFMVRIFNRDLSLGGRWYRSEHLNLTKAQRAAVLIDDCPTIEPDYKSLHFALLYAKEGLELPELPYEIDGYSRDTIKLASLVMLNSNDLGRFKANVTKSGNPKLIELFKTEPSHISLEGFINGMPEGINGADLLQALKTKHAPIAHHFGSKDIGLKLQRLDSDILSSAVHSLSALNIPVLPVHDSIRCKVTDKTTVINTMLEAFKEHMNFNAKIAF